MPTRKLTLTSIYIKATIFNWIIFIITPLNIDYESMERIF